MNDKLSWDDIKKQYPDEWVILVDPVMDESDEIVAGRVLSHDASRRAIHEKLKEVHGEAAILCTRDPQGGVIAALGFARMVIEE